MSFKINNEVKNKRLLHYIPHGVSSEVFHPIGATDPKLIESSCCGMAGSFGYEAEHIEVSKQMAEASLLPSIRKSPDSWVVADGTSCRHQIADGAKRDAVHIAIALAKHLG